MAKAPIIVVVIMIGAFLLLHKVRLLIGYQLLIHQSLARHPCN